MNLLTKNGLDHLQNDLALVARKYLLCLTNAFYTLILRIAS